MQNVRHKQNIGHMRKMCAGGIHCNMCAVCAQSSRYVQNMRSLRTILKICAQYVQFAHILKKKKKKKSSAPVAGHQSKHWAGPMFEYRCFQCGMVSNTYSYSRRPFICAATLPKVSVLIICNRNYSMSWVKRSGSFKYN